MSWASPIQDVNGRSCAAAAGPLFRQQPMQSSPGPSLIRGPHLPLERMFRMPWDTQHRPHGMEAKPSGPHCLQRHTQARLVPGTCRWRGMLFPATLRYRQDPPPYLAVGGEVHPSGTSRATCMVAEQCSNCYLAACAPSMGLTVTIPCKMYLRP